MDFIPKTWGENKDCKIIFLNDKNLSVLKGYKVDVSKKLSVLPDKCGFKRACIIVVITGLSNKAASKLTDELEALPKEEIMEAQ